MEVLAKASGKAERTDNCNYARKQFFPREEIKEGVSKVKAARPEGAEAHSPGPLGSAACLSKNALR